MKESNEHIKQMWEMRLKMYRSILRRLRHARSLEQGIFETQMAHDAAKEAFEGKA